jgi:IPT/TIG domain
MTVEEKLFSSLDVLALTASHQPRTAISIDIARVVEDGFISIAFSYGAADTPFVSAIEISLVAPHLAHAVAGTEPYLAVDIRNEGRANVTFDGSASHTHGVGLVITRWLWEVEGASSTVTGSGATPTISVPVGFHTVTLLVVDSGGNESTERTTVTVYPYGYPAITGISPDRGSIAGNALVRITGSGFTYLASQTIVHFGLITLTGSDLTIVNSTTILLRTPSTTVAVPVPVTVETPLNVSTPVSYTYIASSEILFTSAKFFAFGSVTTGVFGPDGKFYVANFNGQIYKLTMNENFTQVVESVGVALSQTVRRTVLGIAFDPNDVGLSNPPFYCSSSEFFHGGNTSSSGKSINGIIHRISGANMDVVEDIITGLPVSDHDHGTSSREFLPHQVKPSSNQLTIA